MILFKAVMKKMMSWINDSTFFTCFILIVIHGLKLGCIFCLPCFLHAETPNHQDICHTDLDTDQDGVSFIFYCFINVTKC